jgi:hypothetical protein
MPGDPPSTMPKAASGQTSGVPLAVDDMVLLEQGTSALIPILLNDSDPNGNPLSVIAITQPAHGVLTGDNNDVYTYTPTATYVGHDAFTYTLSNGSNTSSATVQMAVNQAIDGEEARNQILAGVSTIHADGLTGHMVAYGPTAYAISHYPPDSNGNFRGPVVAAASWAAGKVVALPDHQALNMDTHGNQATTGQLYKNSIAWLAGSSDQAVQIVTYRQENADWLTSQGYTNVVNTNEAGLASALQSAQVFVAGWLGSSEPQANLDAIAAFVKAGGGLFIADFGTGYDWWWGKAINQAPSNLLLREAGLGFTRGTVGESLLDAAGNRATGQINATLLMEMLANSNGYSSTQLAEGAQLLKGIYNPLPTGDLLAAQLDEFFFSRINQINPTPATAVSDTFEKALLTREADLLESTPAKQVTAHRTAESVYGAIPTNTLRVTRTVTLNTSRTRWQATGLYVVPGEVVSITVPASLVGQNYKVRVNAHKDDISKRSTWERAPRVHRSFEIESRTLQVANAFGGSIFIDFGGNGYSTPPNLGNVPITIANGIEQPYFVLGEDTDQEWVNNLRNKPAPYAVFVSDNIILSFRSSESSDLTEPTDLMTWWNRVGALEDEVANRLEPRTSAELINVDVQNSAGAAHSGYPIQAYDKHWGNLADWDDLRVYGSWGDFHELGHNHQRGWWTFDGDGEVTVNIFSNYALEKATNNQSGGWAYSADPVQVIERAVSDVSGGGSYASKSNRWSYWFQLADGFGWESYKQVFRSYELDKANNPGNLPTTNEEEKDQWFTRWSNQVGYDMKRFMVDTWGLQVSQSAIDSVSALPDWMPVVGGISKIQVVTGNSEAIDISGTALSMDNVATVIDVTNTTSGTLTDNGNGTYTYTPNPGFVGTDGFSYTLQSSAANTQTFHLEIEVVSGLIADYWYNINGTAISDLTGTLSYPNSPDESRILAQLDLPKEIDNNYGAWVRATLLPPTSGLYQFWIASDDSSQLYLSSDNMPENKALMASVSGYTNEYQWNKFPTQESMTVTLNGGESYYIEALLKEGGGGDHLAVAWSGPSIEQELIPANYLKRFTNQAPTFNANPIIEADATEDSPYSSSVADNASEPDVGNPLTFSKESGPTWLTIAANGTLSGTPTNADVGLNQFSVKVDDGRGADAQASLHITVTNVNDSPTIISDTFEIYAGSANGTLVGTVNASDPDANDSLNLSITAGNHDNAFTIDNTGALSVANNSALSSQSTFTLTIEASDSVLSRSATVLIHIFACPTATEVATTANSGSCSLRWAIEQANAGDTITFQSRIQEQTIHLASTITLDKNLILDGGSQKITLSGDSDNNGSPDVQILSINNYRTITLKNLTFSKAKSNTGALYIGWYGTLTIINSTFVDNITSYWSGGAIHSKSALNIYNSTFTDNSAQRSGRSQIISQGGSRQLTITGSTFRSNSTDATGSEISNTSSSSSFTLKNSIISGGSGDACGGSVAPSATSNNIVKDSTCGAASTIDPNLAALADNGGSTHTHALQADSPAIDAGDSATCADGSTINNLDQRGEARDDLACDIGAFELVFTDSNTVTKPINGNGSYTFGPTKVQLTVSNGNNLGNTSSQLLIANEFPQGGFNSNCPAVDNSVQRYFNITPELSGTASVRLYYDDSELNGNDENTLTVWHCNGTSWNNLGATSRNTDTNYVEVTEVSHFSPFLLASDRPSIPPSVSINLNPGWNHIALPLDLSSSMTAESACSQINSQAGNVVEIDHWYAGGWEGHICGLSFNDFEIEMATSYFIKSNATSSWSIEGSSVSEPLSLTLQMGWNSIAIPHTDAYTAESLCDEIINQGGSAVEIDRWHNGGWDGHICGLGFNDFDIERGKGYFVKSSSSSTVTPSEPASALLQLEQAIHRPPTLLGEFYP